MATSSMHEVREVLRGLAGGTPQTVPAMREALESASAFFPIPAGVGVAADDAHGVAVEWITPAGAAGSQTIVYLHGGAYALGSIATHRALMARIAVAAGMRVLGVEYRRAPESPFPAAVEDAHTVYDWLLRRGVRPEEVALAGDSAGAALALAVLMSVRDEGRALPGCAVCICPWVDLECRAESWRENADAEPVLRREPITEMAAAYLAGASARNPLAAPLHADLAGLPPLLVQAGGGDVLRDDARALADKVREAGVDVRFSEWPDAFHVWHSFEQIEEARAAVDEIGGFLRDRIGAREKLGSLAHRRVSP